MLISQFWRYYMTLIIYMKKFLDSDWLRAVQCQGKPASQPDFSPGFQNLREKLGFRIPGEKSDCDAGYVKVIVEKR